MKPELVIVNGPHRGMTIELDFTKELYIGRSKGADVCLIDDKKVSQLHAKILPVSPERFIIEDLGSTNGTYVNGVQMEQTPIQDGDRLKIGHSLMVFRVDAHEIRQSDVNNWLAESSSSEGPDWAAAANSLLGEISNAINARAALAETLAHLTPLLGATRGQALVRNPFNGHVARIGSAPDSEIPEIPLTHDLLRQAASTKETIVDSRGAIASPLYICGNVCGALFFDNHKKARRSQDGDAEFVQLFAQITSMALTRDQQRQIAEIQRDFIELIPFANQPGPTNLTQLLQNSVELYQSIAEARKVELSVDIAPNLSVGCDEIPLSRAVERLCEFCVLSAEGAASIQAKSNANESILLVLHYKGRGFDSGGLANIFHQDGVAEDFQFALTHGLDGVLAFCRGAIELCGGSIQVHSRGKEHGASYQVSLPLPQQPKLPTSRLPSPKRRTTERYF